MSGYSFNSAKPTPAGMVRVTLRQFDGIERDYIMFEEYPHNARAAAAALMDAADQADAQERDGQRKLLDKLKADKASLDGQIAALEAKIEGRKQSGR